MSNASPKWNIPKYTPNTSCIAYFEDVVSQYLENMDGFGNFGLFQDMSTRSTSDYITFVKSRMEYTKAYFVPLLQKVLGFADKHNHTLLAQAMLYNIHDEMQEWAGSFDADSQVVTLPSGNTYDVSLYIKPIEERKQTPHALRRTWELEGLRQSYGAEKFDALQVHRNEGITSFNDITDALLTKRSGLNCVGALLLSEALVPQEFIYLQEARDRLFTNLSDQAKVYLDGHIEHDPKMHYQDILKSLETMNLTQFNVKSILKGINSIYLARTLLYSAYRKS